MAKRRRPDRVQRVPSMGCDTVGDAVTRETRYGLRCLATLKL